MATQLPASSPPTLTDSKPGFFKTFPRELRDDVYDSLYQEVTTNVKGLHFNTRAVLVELRLISRQFRLRYDERSATDEHNKHLTITDDVRFDTFGDWVDGQPSGIATHCPALATRSISLTVHLIACLDGYKGHAVCEIDGDRHTTWVKSLLQSLPHLRNICVRLHLVSPDCISITPDWKELLDALPSCTEMKLVGSTSLAGINW